MNKKERYLRGLVKKKPWLVEYVFEKDFVGIDRTWSLTDRINLNVKIQFETIDVALLKHRFISVYHEGYNQPNFGKEEDVDYYQIDIILRNNEIIKNILIPGSYCEHHGVIKTDTQPETILAQTLQKFIGDVQGIQFLVVTRIGHYTWKNDPPKFEWHRVIIYKLPQKGKTLKELIVQALLDEKLQRRQCQ